MDVPDPAVHGDRAAADRWRDTRRAARTSWGAAQVGPVALALATDGRSLDTGAQLIAGGADLVGLLAPEPLESLAWAAAAGARRAYPDLRSLLADEVEAVCVDLDLPASGPVARSAVHAGLHVLLARPELDDAEMLRDLVDGSRNFDVDVTAALAVRTWPSLPAAQDLLPALGALRQVTVVGWPLGRAARLELVDLVRRLCGDVLAVCAAPAAMPAADLRPGEPVTLALLTASGATVLAGERPARSGRVASLALSAAAVTVVGTDGRLVLGPDFLRRQDARGVAASSLPTGQELPSALEVALGDLGGWGSGGNPDVDAVPEAGFDAGHPTGRAGDRTPAATVGDLLAASRVLQVATASLSAGTWLEI